VAVEKQHANIFKTQQHFRIYGGRIYGSSRARRTLGVSFKVNTMPPLKKKESKWAI